MSEHQDADAVACSKSQGKRPPSSIFRFTPGVPTILIACIENERCRRRLLRVERGGDMEWNAIAGAFLIFGSFLVGWYRSKRKRMESGPPYDPAHNTRVLDAATQTHIRLAVSSSKTDIVQALELLVPHARGGVLEMDDRRSEFAFGAVLFALIAIWLIYKSFPSFEPLLKPPVITFLTIGGVAALVAIQIRENRRSRQLLALGGLIKRLLAQLDQRYTQILDADDRQRWLAAHLALCPGLIPAGAERATAHTLVHGNHPSPAIIFSVIGIYYETTESRLSGAGDSGSASDSGWVDETVSHERAAIVFPPQMARLFSAQVIERLAGEKVSVVCCDSGYVYAVLPTHPFSGDAIGTAEGSLSVREPARLIDAIRSGVHIDSPLLARVILILGTAKG